MHTLTHAMSVAFWSCELKAGDTIVEQPPAGYVLNIQNAALHSTCKGAAVVRCITQNIEGDESKTVLCTLRGERTEQCNLCEYWIFATFTGSLPLSLTHNTQLTQLAYSCSFLLSNSPTPQPYLPPTYPPIFRPHLWLRHPHHFHGRGRQQGHRLPQRVLPARPRR